MESVFFSRVVSQLTMPTMACMYVLFVAPPSELLMSKLLAVERLCYSSDSKQ